MVQGRCIGLVMLAAMAIGRAQTLPAAAASPWIAPDTIMTAARSPFDALVKVAIDDLAQRLNIDPASIDLVEARAVVWPDRSLGCPRPGMVYPQVQQDGTLIRLRAQGREFAYHGGGSRAPFLCDRSS